MSFEHLYLLAWAEHLDGNKHERNVALVHALGYCTDANRGHDKIRAMIDAPLGVPPRVVR